ncbi:MULTISPECIES: 2-oxoglutarate and iron-dependent oxygenase domain-containing protein [Roseivirga]|uniref:isopenicillin N synthase family dioxygenase n=1 Tax=Roseivirga TaxID=290180 RepID=UPI00258084CB|nr:MULTISPECIES: 2-oxoglutarate and iron-dependent oxygenase domain-containing protein [Roseivirga]MEC7755963.1 2-oxoglutarate and iron-dependent oxygenase domain-containing protein [Bacteroidota bacterium]|tara:strand:- start:6229 stop:7203 length:975 start_codon:yes stop_codon:yes gene_type:complete
MSSILYDEVPSLDLAHFTNGSPEQKEAFVQDLGAAYNNIGFVAIKNHGLTNEMTEKLYAAIQKFFALPDEVKQKYEVPELAGQRGYIGKGKEHAKGRSTGDLKEFYHIGQEVTDGDPIKNEYPDNIWPEEVPEMEAIGKEVYKTLENAGVKMLQAIALYLGLDEHYFDQKVHNGNSILRPIHYFPIENPEAVPADAVRAAEHGDINLITLLMGASADGLQVLRNDGKWIPITALPDQLVVNVGDMLSRHTNNKLKSTIHRVVNPPKDKMGTSRYSIPFFMHPRSEMDLTCLESCIDDAHPKLYDDITAGEFLEQRLAEIGLRKK